MNKENEITKKTDTVLRTYSDIEKAARAMAASRYFSDAKEVSQAIVKIMAGREMGFGAFASMAGVHIIKGKPTLGANLIGAAVKKTGKYNYRIVEHNEQVCSIDFYENGEKVGNSKFTLDDAEEAGILDNPAWRKYPRNMLFARAISNGQKWFAPDIFNGATVYTPEELKAVDESGDIVDGEILSEQEHPAATQKLSRPFSSKGLRSVLARKASALGNVPETSLSGETDGRQWSKRQILAGEYDKILGDQSNRHEVFEYLFGKRSSKELTPAQVLAALAHLNSDRRMAENEIKAVFENFNKEK